MTSAGMVSGSRQRNSTSRVAAGTCSLTQIIVGTSRTTIPTLAMPASSRDVRIASLISGLSNSARQAAPVPSLVIVSLVLTLSSASRGTAKKSPKHRSRTTRVIRHDHDCVTGDPPPSPEPPRGTPQHQGVGRHHYRDDDHHLEGECEAEPLLPEDDLAGERGADEQWRDERALADQRRRGRIGREGVREQEERAAQERRPQQRQRHLDPVLERGGPQVDRRLTRSEE